MKRFVFSTVLLLFPVVLALDNGLGRTPAMGYNTWYDLMGELNENNLKASVDVFVQLGLKELGYEYFNLDDMWAAGRYANGTLYADETKFPSRTLFPLAEYVHGKGLKFGTYTDRGTKTCGGKPGALGHEKLDAATYASWGVDYLKEDSCNAPTDHISAFQEYGLMRDALNETGRPILFSLCGWESWYAPEGNALANSWRIGPDDTNWNGVLVNININSNLAQYAVPGAFNDPCLLLSTDWQNNQRVTPLQSRAQFSMWVIMASPLLISGNIRNMSKYVIETYTNADAIGINQDKLGKQGVRALGSNLTTTDTKADDTNVWIKKLENDGIALAFINVGAEKASVLCDAVCFSNGGIEEGITLCGKEVYSGTKVKFATSKGLSAVNLSALGGSALYKLEVC